jgi:very-short-patch-repair endonuclease
VSRVFDRNPSDDERAELAALYDRGQKLCESPIERNLLAALVTGDWPMCRQVLPAVHNAKNYDEAFPLNEVVIIPQMTILRFRSDIGLVVGPMNRRPVIVGLECDGKEFHQDGERDRQRDSYFRALGVPVIRISGAALNIEPIAVADGIIETVTRWASE